MSYLKENICKHLFIQQVSQVNRCSHSRRSSIQELVPVSFPSPSHLEAVHLECWREVGACLDAADADDDVSFSSHTKFHSKEIQIMPIQSCPPYNSDFNALHTFAFSEGLFFYRNQ